MSDFTNQLRQPSGYASIDDERAKAADEIERMTAELATMNQRRDSNEAQLVQIAQYIGKDARHAPEEDRSIAGLVIAELKRLTTERGEARAILADIRRDNWPLERDGENYVAIPRLVWIRAAETARHA